MKKTIILLISLLGICSAECFGQLRSQTSPVFELSGIVFRLAGAEEYQNEVIPAYTKEIDKYFAPYSEHALIKYIREIRSHYAIGYDAVMKAAGPLCIIGGHVQLYPDYEPADIVSIDARWTEEVYRTYVGLLDEFYQDSRFNQFYSTHEELYELARERLDEVLVLLDTEWFLSFFGQELGTPAVFTALCNGRANYSLGNALGRGIVLGCRADGDGLPTYSDFSTLPLIVHEFVHSYSNPLLDKFWSDDLSPAALEIYPHVQHIMERSGYGDPGVMMTEWFARLCELMYFREHPITLVSMKRLIGNEQQKGFIWLKRSAEHMEGFYADRQTYPTIADYMPRLLSLFKETALDFDRVIEEYNASYPHVENTCPESGGIVEGDEIIIKFSEPMFTAAYGWGQIQDGETSFTPVKKEFWRDSTTFVFKLKPRKLKNGNRYGIRLHHSFFQSEAGFPIKEDFFYYFQTK